MSNSAAASPVSDVLARFVVDTGWDDVPEPARREAKRSLLNYAGGAIAVAHDPAIDIAIAVAGRFSSGREAQILGRPERMDVASASFVNAVTANLLDYDDTHLRTVIHPTAPVAPVALALAEQLGKSGEDALLALALGIEVECRLGNAVMPGHYARGWHITATCGVFGAAVAAANVKSVRVIIA